jgi:hypothetical protein
MVISLKKLVITVSLISCFSMNLFASTKGGYWLATSKCTFPGGEKLNCSISLSLNDKCRAEMTYLNESGKAKHVNVNCDLSGDTLTVTSRNFFPNEYHTFMRGTLRQASNHQLLLDDLNLLPLFDFDIVQGEFQYSTFDYQCFIGKNELGGWKSTFVSDEDHCFAARKAFRRALREDTSRKMRYFDVKMVSMIDTGSVTKSYQVIISYNSPIVNSALWLVDISQSDDYTRTTDIKQLF